MKSTRVGTPTISRRQTMALIAAGLGLLPGGAQAAGFPERAVTLIVPFAAGGTTDVLVRKQSDLLRSHWGQPVIVLNRTGAATIIATQVLMRAPADGHTILVAPDPTFTVNPLMYPHLPYDPDRDLAPITTLITYPLGIAVTRSLGVSSLKELVALSKTRSLNYGSFGIGTAPHLVMEIFKAQSGCTMAHIPFAGIAPTLLAMGSNDVHATVMGAGAGLPSVQSGLVQFLAIDSRAPLLPGVPTFAEAGYPDLRAPSWWGATVPIATPAPIVAQLQRDIAATLSEPDMLRFLQTNGYEAVGDRPEDLATRIRTSREYWAPIVKNLTIRIE